jgi:hypothetical protein
MRADTAPSVSKPATSSSPSGSGAMPGSHSNTTTLWLPRSTTRSPPGAAIALGVSIVPSSRSASTQSSSEAICSRVR